MAASSDDDMSVLRGPEGEEGNSDGYDSDQPRPEEVVGQALLMEDRVPDVNDLQLVRRHPERSFEGALGPRGHLGTQGARWFEGW